MSFSDEDYIKGKRSAVEIGELLDKIWKEQRPGEPFPVDPNDFKEFGSTGQMILEISLQCSMCWNYFKSKGMLKALCPDCEIKR